jgi:hypothetical protein
MISKIDKILLNKSLSEKNKKVLNELKDYLKSKLDNSSNSQV